MDSLQVSHLESLIATEWGMPTLAGVFEAIKKQEAIGMAPISPCATVWTSGVIAYRCKTCQKSPNSALCVSCFQQGNHEGHDYLIYESGSGGCCDCGDSNAIAAEGWCSEHRCASDGGAGVGASSEGDACCGLTPAGWERVVLLLAIAIRRLQDTLAAMVAHPLDFAMKHMERCNLLAFLNHLCGYGVFRRLIVDALEIHRDRLLVLDEIMGPPQATSLAIMEDQLLLRIFYDNIKPLEPLPSVQEEVVETITRLMSRVPSILPELTTLLLKLLYEPDFKQAFVPALLPHYKAHLLHEDNSPHQSLSEAINRLHVQLFTDPTCAANWLWEVIMSPLIFGIQGNAWATFTAAWATAQLFLVFQNQWIQTDPLIQMAAHVRQSYPDGDLGLTLQMIHENELLDTLLNSLLELLEATVASMQAVPGLFGAFMSTCVDVGHIYITGKRYSQVLSDIRAVLSHPQVVYDLLTGAAGSFLTICKCLRLLDHMDTFYCNATGDHAEYDPTNWKHSIPLEVVAFTSTISVIVATLKPAEGDSLATIREKLQCLQRAAQMQFQRMSMPDPESMPNIDELKVCFEMKATETMPELVGGFPVSAHTTEKQACGAVLAALYECWDRLDESGGASELMDRANLLVTPADRLWCLTCLALSSVTKLAWLSQIQSGMWVRNGEACQQIAMLYRDAFWREVGYDLDIVMLQTWFASLDPSWTVPTFLKAFKLSRKPLDQKPEKGWAPLDVPNDPPPVLFPSVCLRYLVTILRERNLYEQDPDAKLRRELVHWLAKSEQSYSDLHYCLATELQDNPNIDKVLAEVADFVPPALHAQGGRFRLKAACWEEFDPFFVHYTSRQLHDALENAHAHKWEAARQLMPPPPPGRSLEGLNRVLAETELHRFAWRALCEASLFVGNSNEDLALPAMNVIALVIDQAVFGKLDEPEQLRADLRILLEGGVQRLPESSGRPYEIQPSVLSVLQVLANGRDAGWQMRACAEFLLSIARDFLDLYNLRLSMPSLRDARLRAVEHAETSISPAVSDCKIPSYEDIAASLARKLEWEINGEALESLSRQSEWEDGGEMSDSLAIHGRMASDPGGKSNDSLSKRFEEPPVKRRAFMSEFDERKRMAKAKQEAAMAAVRAQQAAFAKQISAGANDFNMEIDEPAAGGMGSSHAGKASGADPEADCEDASTAECALCEGESTDNGPLALVAHVHLCCEPLQAYRRVPQWQEVPVRPNELGGKVDMSPTSVEYALLPSIFQRHWGLHVLCCGHKLHLPCLERYQERLLQQELADGIYEGAGVIRAEAGEFLCPTCRRISNTVLPALVPEPSEADRSGSQDTAAASFGETAPSSQDIPSTSVEGRASTGTDGPETGASGRDVKALSVEKLIADAQAALEGPFSREATARRQDHLAGNLDCKEPAHLHPALMTQQRQINDRRHAIFARPRPTPREALGEHFPVYQAFSGMCHEVLTAAKEKDTSLSCCLDNTQDLNANMTDLGLVMAESRNSCSRYCICEPTCSISIIWAALGHNLAHWEMSHRGTEKDPRLSALDAANWRAMCNLSALAENLTAARMDESSHPPQQSPREVLAWLGCLDKDNVKISLQVGNAMSALRLDESLCMPSDLDVPFNAEPLVAEEAAASDEQQSCGEGVSVGGTDAAEPSDVEMGEGQPAEAESSMPSTTPERQRQAPTIAQAPQQRAMVRPAGLDGAQPSMSGHLADLLLASSEGRVISPTPQQLTAARALGASSSTGGLASAQQEGDPARNDRLAGGQPGSVRVTSPADVQPGSLRVEDRVEDSADASSAQELKREELQGDGEASHLEASVSAEESSVTDKWKELEDGLEAPQLPGTWAAIIGDPFQLLLQLSALMQPAKPGELPQDRIARDRALLCLVYHIAVAQANLVARTIISYTEGSSTDGEDPLGADGILCFILTYGFLLPFLRQAEIWSACRAGSPPPPSPTQEYYIDGQERAGRSGSKWSELDPNDIQAFAQRRADDEANFRNVKAAAEALQRRLGFPDVPNALLVLVQETQAKSTSLLCRWGLMECCRRVYKANRERPELFKDHYDLALRAMQQVQPRLIQLPAIYQDLYIKLAGEECPKCYGAPQEPAMCLVCGDLMCATDISCNREEEPCYPGPCCRHAAECGGGTAMFLLIKATCILVLQGSRAYIVPSPYLDAHGEEDPHLTRGRPLRLNSARWRRIEALWATGGLAGFETLNSQGARGGTALRGAQYY